MYTLLLCWRFDEVINSFIISTVTKQCLENKINLKELTINQDKIKYTQEGFGEDGMSK